MFKWTCDDVSVIIFYSNSILFYSQAQKSPGQETLEKLEYNTGLGDILKHIEAS